MNKTLKISLIAVFAVAALLLGMVNKTDAYITKIYNSQSIGGLLAYTQRVSYLNPYPNMYFKPSIAYVQPGYQFFLVNARPNYPGTYAVKIWTRAELLQNLSQQYFSIQNQLANPNLTNAQKNQLLRNLNNILLYTRAVQLIK